MKEIKMVMPNVLATAALSLTLLSSAALGADYFAVVYSTGGLARGKGAVSTDHTPGSGTYVVHFSARIKKCAFLATIGNPGTRIEPPGSITTAPRGFDPDAVFVQTTDLAGASTDRDFYLFVDC